MLEFALSQETDENSAAPSPGGGPGGESFVLFRRWSNGQRYPLNQRKSNFLFLWGLRSMGRPASSLSPTTHFASSQECTVRGRCTSPRTSGQSRLGPREFGEDASECTAFCTIHPYSLSLHHHRYVDCAVGATCTACLAGSRAQFDSATRFSSSGDLLSSTAFSRLRWQSGTPLSCVRRLLSSWQRMQSSQSLQPR